MNKFFKYNRGQILTAFARYNKDFYDRISRLQLADWEQAAVLNDQYFHDSYKKIYQTTGTYFAEKITAKLKPKKAQNDNYWLQYFENYAKSKVGKRITWITETTEAEFKRITRNVIAEAVSGGWGEEKAGRELRKAIGISEKYRAERIARTETVSASNAGNIEGAKSLGMNLQKEWITAVDNRVRGLNPNDEFDHVSMNGVVVGMDEDFDVGGELLEYPGDPRGSAGNVINCRCSVQFIPVE